MSGYAYKPRLGFDIRVRPPGEKFEDPEVWTGPTARACAAPGCSQSARVRVAESPRKLQEKLWLCPEHARAHNLQWNFFDGLSDKEAEAARLAGVYGDRPTWSFAKNDRARGGPRGRGFADMFDAFGLFRDGAQRQTRDQGPVREGRRVPRLQAQAFATLGLAVTAPPGEIRRRYAELLRRYHPDSNGGDRSAEAQLIEVVKAHQILKKARVC